MESESRETAPTTKLNRLATFPTVVASVRRVSETLVTLQLVLDEPQSYVFDAGQFLYCFAPLEGGEVRRPYSISSPSSALPRFDLCVSKVNPKGVSGWLYNLETGSTLQVSRALGTFTFKSPPGREVVFLATGTGVAPFRAMLLERLAAADSRRFTLVLGSGHAVNLAYHDEFKALARSHPNFQYVPTLTRATEFEWSGARGRVQERFLESFQGRTDIDVYVCGIPVMVHAVKALLRDGGLPPKQIFSEIYV